MVAARCAELLPARLRAPLIDRFEQQVQRGEPDRGDTAALLQVRQHGADRGPLHGTRCPGEIAGESPAVGVARGYAEPVGERLELREQPGQRQVPAHPQAHALLPGRIEVWPAPQPVADGGQHRVDGRPAQHPVEQAAYLVQRRRETRAGHAVRVPWIAQRPPQRGQRPTESARPAGWRAGRPGPAGPGRPGTCSPADPAGPGVRPAPRRCASQDPRDPWPGPSTCRGWRLRPASARTTAPGYRP